MKKMAAIGLVACLVLFAGCAKFRAMKGPVDGDAVNGAFVDYVVDRVGGKVDLNDEQRAQLERCVTHIARQALEQRAEAEDIRRLMAEELRKERLDLAALNDLLDRRVRLARQALASGEDEFAALHASLDAEQREALAQLVLEHGRPCRFGRD